MLAAQHSVQCALVYDSIESTILELWHTPAVTAAQLAISRQSNSGYTL
jgi:hypothetical protein